MHAPPECHSTDSQTQPAGRPPVLWRDRSTSRWRCRLRALGRRQGSPRCCPPAQSRRSPPARDKQPHALVGIARKRDVTPGRRIAGQRGNRPAHLKSASSVRIKPRPAAVRSSVAIGSLDIAVVASTCAREDVRSVRIAPVRSVGWSCRASPQGADRPVGSSPFGRPFLGVSSVQYLQGRGRRRRRMPSDTAFAPQHHQPEQCQPPVRRLCWAHQLCDGTVSPPATPVAHEAKSAIAEGHRHASAPGAFE